MGTFPVSVEISKYLSVFCVPILQGDMFRREWGAAPLSQVPWLCP